MKLVQWPLMGGVLHLVQRGEDWAGPQPAQAPCLSTKCNSPPINGQCTDHRIDDRLLCGFNVPVKGEVDYAAVSHAETRQSEVFETFIQIFIHKPYRIEISA